MSDTAGHTLGLACQIIGIDASTMTVRPDHNEVVGAAARRLRASGLAVSEAGEITLTTSITPSNQPSLTLTTSLTVGASLALGTVSTDGIVLQNTTAATAGVPVQQSPRLRLRSNVWNTTATAANNTNDWFIESVPVSGGAPTGLLKFGSSLNGGAATYPLTVTSYGAMTTLSTIVSGGNFFATTFGGYTWGGARSFIASSADAKIEVTTQAQSAGVGLDVTTDAVLKIRTRAQTGYATVDCLGLKASGVAGVTFGPAAIASITIVNGIVTAAS